MVRHVPALGGLLALGGCSLLFDATDLTGGSGDESGPTDGALTATGATGPTTTSSGGGGNVTSSTSSTGSSTAGGEGAGGEGAAGTSTAGAGGDGGAGGGGGVPCGDRFCETVGADAERCFDFDGADPLAGLEAWDPDSATITTTVETVEEPVSSCPRAVASRVEEVGSDERAFAFLGFDLPLGADAFVWSFAVHRLTSESDSSGNTIAHLSWDSGDTLCQVLIQMRDTGPTEGRVNVYSQAYDGTTWQPVGSCSLVLPHRTLGEWTQVEVEVDLAATGTVTLRADGVDASTVLDPMCGPSTTHYDLDVGHHFSNRVQSTVFDDITVRYPGG